MNKQGALTKRRKWGKRVFQLVALTLVAWGVWQSIRQSTAELGRQQSELASRAEELLQQAAQADDPLLQQRLEAEAQELATQSRRFWQASPGMLVVAGLLYVAAMLPASLFWRRCLMQLQQASHLLDILWAYFYGNLGKYFPGKAMVIVLRLSALEHHRVKKTATTITIFMETLTMMSVGGAVAALCMIWLNIDWRLTALALGLLCVTFIPTSPPVLQYLLPRLQKGVPVEQLEHWTNRLSWGLFLRGWLLLSLSWLLNGLSLMVVMLALPTVTVGEGDWLVLFVSSCGACALAVVLGFVSLIPGGAGVREVVLSMVLTPVVGPTAALCSAVWMRVVWLTSELSVVALLSLVRGLPAMTGRQSSQVVPIDEG